jgi:autotransporter-associated beta strand protein
VVLAEAQNIGLSIGWNGGNGEVDLGGGLLVANFIQSGKANAGALGEGSSTFNFNGGTLRAGPAARLNFMSNYLDSAVVYHNSTIDTTNQTIDIAQPLTDGGGGGGINKAGSGTLLLDGVDTYTGTTTVGAGTLGGSGTITGPVVVNSGATLAPGDQALGTLTLGNTLALAGGSQTVMWLNGTANTNSSVLGASAVTYSGAEKHRRFVAGGRQL